MQEAEDMGNNQLHISKMFSLVLMLLQKMHFPTCLVLQANQGHSRQPAIRKPAPSACRGASPRNWDDLEGSPM